MWLFNLLFSSLSQLWYVEVRISRSVSVSPLEFEITRVDYIINYFSRGFHYSILLNSDLTIFLGFQIGLKLNVSLMPRLYA